MEEVVHKHVFNFLRDNNVFSPLQSGFIPGDSTGNQLAERIADFLTLQSKEIIIPAAHESTKGMLATEIQQYESFARERLSEKHREVFRSNQMQQYDADCW